MGNWIINIIIGVLITLAILTFIQLGFNWYTGAWPQ